MSFSIIRQIPLIVTAGNEAIIKASYTNAFASSSIVSSVSIRITEGGGANSSFQLLINSIKYTFVYEANPQLDQQQYSTDLFACFAQTAVLARYFVVTKQSTNIILTTRSGEVPTIELGKCNSITLSLNSTYAGTPAVANSGRWLCNLEKVGTNKLIGPIESVPIPSGTGYTGETIFNAAYLLSKNKKSFFNFPNTSKLFAHNILEQYTPHIFLQEGIPSATMHYAKGNSFYSLPGTLSDTRLAALNSSANTFADLLTTSKMFLSWRSNNRETDIYMPQRLYFIAQESGTYSLKVKKWYTEDFAPLIETLSSITVTAFQTIEVCCGWADVRSGHDAAPLRYYEVWLEKNATEVSEHRRFILDYNYYQYARYFLYRNALGAYDIIRTTGKLKQILDIKKVISRISLPNDFTEQNAKTRQLSDSASIKYAINSGYIESTELIELQDFLRSGEVYWLRNGTLVGVQVSEKEYELPTDDDDFNSIPFEIELAQSDDYIIASKPLLPVEIGDFDDDFNEDYLA